MAELRRDGDQLVVALTVAEKAEAVHGDIHVPYSSVKSVEVTDDAMSAVPVIKAPGARVPGYMAVGTFYSGLGEGRTKTFAAVHHTAPRGVIVRLEGASFDELVIGCEDPEAVASAILPT